MDRGQKENLVASLKSSLEQASFVLVAKQLGLTVSEVTELRRKMRQVGAGYKVAKNTLVKLAVKGTPYEALTDYFSGPTAIAFSSDPVGAAKVVVEFSKSSQKVGVVVAQMGLKVLAEADVKFLAALPSQDELRAKLVGLLKAPAVQLAAVTQAPSAKIARVLSAFGAKS